MAWSSTLVNMSDRTAELPSMLRALRASKGWSQAEVAAKASIRQRLLSNYENGKLTPRLETARRLAGVYGVTVDSLFGDAVHLSRQNHTTSE